MLHSLSHAPVAAAPSVSSPHGPSVLLRSCPAASNYSFLTRCLFLSVGPLLFSPLYKPPSCNTPFFCSLLPPMYLSFTTHPLLFYMLHLAQRISLSYLHHGISALCFPIFKQPVARGVNAVCLFLYMLIQPHALHHV